MLDDLAVTHTVIAVDLPGHGESDAPAGDYSLGALAAALRDVLVLLGLPSATIVGHSLGGGVALQFAYQFPERTDRLVLVSSGGLGPQLTPMLRRLPIAAATIAGFVESTTAGIVVIVFFVLYQQLENHLLQPLIFSRTVKVNPLTVLIAILIAVELAGILGALLAIPVAGIIQIIARDIWDTRRGRLKIQPTVGEDEIPVDASEPVQQRQRMSAVVSQDGAAAVRDIKT